MTDLRYIAERWIAEHGPETPQVVRAWASELQAAPSAAQFLFDIAATAQVLLDERAQRSAGPPRSRRPSSLP